jgi:indole-3-glycerol phosphate synthase
METILDTILEETALELERRMKAMPLGRLEKALASLEPVRDFAGALLAPAPGPRIIAEIKRASPSAGVIREDFYPVEVALAYEAGGAAALSILTNERHFQGKLEHLALIRRFVELPILRKDFIIHPYQVTESRVAGADAVLLIVGILTDSALEECLGTARALGLHALVEVHTEEELERALEMGASIVGINNRDLRSFRVDINTTLELIGKVPDDRIVVSESGISSPEDVRRLGQAGVKAVLIGEAFMRASDIRAKLEEFVGSA